jgi:alpha-N-acetylglucosaminidase
MAGKSNLTLGIQLVILLILTLIIMIKKIVISGITATVMLASLMTTLNSCKDVQIIEASGVIGRVLPEYADRFILKLIDKEANFDVFEIEANRNKIIIKGSSGVAICSGFNYYLKNFCHSEYNWRCGENLKITGGLATDFGKIRKVSPCKYRYMFNYCTFSYSMAFWDWEQWEKMIDWMAMNGINMPLAPMGQEIIWQRVYKKYGLSEADLKDFFVGPAYNAFGRMGCIDGFGGPLPQSWIQNENKLQKKILLRERQLGMKPVLQGFTGHVPSAFIKKNPKLNYSNLTWIDFPQTYLLDWEEPEFTAIGKDFISELKKEYGTDHLYAIDQFIEMKPVNGDTLYLKDLSRKIFSAIDQADPSGIWVIQTWPFKDLDFWNQSRTRSYFDGVPDNRMIALELMGESWKATGWYKQDGWHGKPWIWSIISNFGDKVSMFGGLTQISENYKKALISPGKGNMSGMGMMNEGLDYNPVTYEFITDMMWEKEVPDLTTWKRRYLQARYGLINGEIIKGWEYIFNYYYTREGLFEDNPINGRPNFIKKDIFPSETSVSGASLLLKSSDMLKDNDAYQFDIVNLFRQVFGQYAGHLLFEITNSYQGKDIEKFDESVKKFTALSMKIEQLLATRTEFLLGKWIGDSRKHAANAEEEKLYEWNAKAIITTWGGRVLYGYALKDWAGMYSSYYLPRWKKFFESMRSEISGGEKIDYSRFKKDIMQWEDNWVGLREETIQSVPKGNSIIIANELWQEYGHDILNNN